MNLVGFDHVFARSVAHSIAENLSIKTIPPVVLALTKIVSFTDDPYRRAKDLTDIRSLLARYEEYSDRIFDEVVFEAQLSDITLANAFVLGLDLAQICRAEEIAIIEKFVRRFEDKEDQFALQVASLKKGLTHRS